MRICSVNLNKSLKYKLKPCLWHKHMKVSKTLVSLFDDSDIRKFLAQDLLDFPSKFS